MKKIHINLGGILGSLILGLPICIYVFGFTDYESLSHPGKRVALAFFAGGYLGNYMYSRFIYKETPDQIFSNNSIQNKDRWTTRRLVYTTLGVLIGIPMLIGLIDYIVFKLQKM